MPLRDVAPERLLSAAPGSCRCLWILKLPLPAAKGEFWTLGGRLASRGGTGRAPPWLPAWLPLPAATVLVPVCQGRAYSRCQNKSGREARGREHLAPDSPAGAGTCLKNFPFDGCWFCPALVTRLLLSPPYAPSHKYTFQLLSCIRKSLDKSFSTHIPPLRVPAATQQLPRPQGTGQLSASSARPVARRVEFGLVPLPQARSESLGRCEVGGTRQVLGGGLQMLSAWLV